MNGHRSGKLESNFSLLNAFTQIQYFIFYYYCLYFNSICVHFPIQWIFRGFARCAVLKSYFIVCCKWQTQVEMRRKNSFTKSKLNFHLWFWWWLCRNSRYVVQLGMRMTLQEFLVLNFRVICNGLFVNKGIWFDVLHCWWFWSSWRMMLWNFSIKTIWDYWLNFMLD